MGGIETGIVVIIEAGVVLIAAAYGGYLGTRQKEKQ